MPKDVLEKIKYLCKMIPEVEWSGVLFYEVKGSIKNPKDMSIILKDILPMHKGTKSYTEYELDDRYMDYLMEEGKEERMSWKMGHIHSHNTMNVFFSGTDWSELNDNSGSHNFYLSLIVNNYMDFEAKVGFRGTVDIETDSTPYYALDENGEKYIIDESKFTVKKEKLYVHDCVIEAPRDVVNVPQDFGSKVDGIIKDAVERAKVKTTTYHNPYMGGPSGVGFKSNQQQHKPLTKVKQKPSEIVRGFVDDIPFDDLEGLPFLNVDEMSDIEEFAITLLRGTNPPDDQIDSIELALEEIAAVTQGDVPPEEISKNLMENYPALYDKFFDNETDDHFVEVSEEVINIFEDWEGNYPFLSNAIMALKYMVHKFEEYATGTTV